MSTGEDLKGRPHQYSKKGNAKNEGPVLFFVSSTRFMEA